MNYSSTKLLQKIEFQGCWVIQGGSGRGVTQNTLFCYYVNDALWSCEMWVFTISLDQCILGKQWPWSPNSTASLACKHLSLPCDHQIRCQSPIQGPFTWWQKGKTGVQFSFLLNICACIHKETYHIVEGLWKFLFSLLLFII